MKPNPKLEPLSFLVGEWRTTGTHPLMPGETIRGRITFEWHEGGAFLLMRSEMEDTRFPRGVAIIASDGEDTDFQMVYFDERPVSRRYVFTLRGNVWEWSRESPTFSQRFTVTVAEGGRKMISVGKMSKNGGPWEDDLSLTYERLGR